MRSILLAAVVPFALFVFAAPSLAATSPDSKACSEQATAKGLHGADREAFRTACMKGAAPAAKPTTVPAAKPATMPAAKPAVATPAAKPAAIPAPAKPAPTAAAPKSAAFTASSPASKACSEKADAKGLHGKERETFRDQCLKGSAPAAAAKSAPAAKPAAAAKPAPAAMREAVPAEPGSTAAKQAKPSAPGTRSPAQLAADQRIHACGQQWQAAKAAGKIPAGQTWPKYWSACSDRMKAK